MHPIQMSVCMCMCACTLSAVYHFSYRLLFYQFPDV